VRLSALARETPQETPQKTPQRRAQHTPDRRVDALMS
jgi:hypothetical protein